MCKVRCADCGFLTFRNLETRELVSAEEMTRRTGELPQKPSRESTMRERVMKHAAGALVIYEQEPTCFVGAMDLRAEGSNRLEIIQCERDCDRFTAWKPELTAREHAQMERDEKLLKWQAEQAALAHKRHIQSTVATVLVTLGVALSCVAAVFIARKMGL